MYPTDPRGHLLRMQPMAAIPTTRATTSQRMRRVCVNIAANGSSYPPVKRRRRRFARTMAMATPTMLWNCQDTFGLVEDGNQQMGRLSSGQDYSISPFFANKKTGNHTQTSSQDTLCSNSPRTQTSLFPPCENESVTQHTINELKSILKQLERNVQQEERTKSDREPEFRQEESFQNSQLHVLTNLLSETNDKLDSYILNQAVQHDAIMSTSSLKQMNLLARLKGGRQRRSLPVLPLFVQTLPTPVSSRPHLCRTFPQRDRRRRRPMRSAYIHLENRSCSTADLDVLPRILLARTTGGVTQNLRDSGTTMWCPMNCCREHFCGVVENSSEQPSLEVKDKIVTPIPYPMQPSPTTIETTFKYEDDSTMSPPPLPKTPPPRDRIQKEEIYRVAGGSYDFSMDGSSNCSSQEFSYSYLDGMRQNDLHERYSNMDIMDQYYRERKPEVQTSNKQLQTEIETTESTTSTSGVHHHIIVTTDKAVGTTQFQNEVKNSSLPKARFSEGTTPSPKLRTLKTNTTLSSSGFQMPTLQQSHKQKFKCLDKSLKRKTGGKQETEESTWYHVASGSYHLPPYKSYPTC